MESVLDGITVKQREVFEYILDNPKITRKAIADRMGINESAVQKHIKALIVHKVIERVGTNKGYWKLLIER